MASLLVALLIALTIQTHAQIYTWNGTADGVWSNSANWDLGTVPNGPSAMVIIADSCTSGCVLTVDIPVEVQSLELKFGYYSTTRSTLKIESNLTIHEIMNTSSSNYITINVTSSGSLNGATSASLFRFTTTSSYGAVNFWGPKNISFELPSSSVVNVYGAMLMGESTIVNYAQLNVWGGYLEKFYCRGSSGDLHFYNGDVWIDHFEVTTFDTFTIDNATLHVKYFEAGTGSYSVKGNASTIIVDNFNWTGMDFTGDIRIIATTTWYLNSTTSYLYLSGGATFINKHMFYFSVHDYGFYTNDGSSGLGGVVINDVNATIKILRDPSHPSREAPIKSGIWFYNYGLIDASEVVDLDKGLYLYLSYAEFHNNGTWLGVLHIYYTSKVVFLPGTPSNDANSSWLYCDNSGERYFVIQSNMTLSNFYFTDGYVTLDGAFVGFQNGSFGTSGSTTLNATNGNLTATVYGYVNHTGLEIASVWPASLNFYIPDGSFFYWQYDTMYITGSAKLTNNGTWYAVTSSWEYLYTEATTEIWNLGTMVIPHYIYWRTSTSGGNPGTFYNLGTITLMSSSNVYFDNGGMFIQCKNGAIEFTSSAGGSIGQMKFSRLALDGSFRLRYQSGTPVDVDGTTLFTWDTSVQTTMFQGAPSTLVYTNADILDPYYYFHLCFDSSTGIAELQSSISLSCSLTLPGSACSDLPSIPHGTGGITGQVAGGPDASTSEEAPPSRLSELIGGIIGAILFIAIIAAVVWYFVIRPQMEAKPQLREQLL